ncbi:hypothetical protein ACVI1L_003731 [Bradyrhizobium sp. USDA 4516]
MIEAGAQALMEINGNFHGPRFVLELQPQARGYWSSGNCIWIRAASKGPKKRGPRSEIPDQSGRLGRPASQRNPKNELKDDSERQSERQSEKLTFSDLIDARIRKEFDRE